MNVLPIHWNYRERADRNVLFEDRQHQLRFPLRKPLCPILREPENLYTGRLAKLEEHKRRNINGFAYFFDQSICDRRILLLTVQSIKKRGIGEGVHPSSPSISASPIASRLAQANAWNAYTDRNLSVWGSNRPRVKLRSVYAFQAFACASLLAM